MKVKVLLSLVMFASTAFGAAEVGITKEAALAKRTTHAAEVNEGVVWNHVLHNEKVCDYTTMHCYTCNGGSAIGITPYREYVLSIGGKEQNPAEPADFYNVYSNGGIVKSGDLTRGRIGCKTSKKSMLRVYEGPGYFSDGVYYKYS